MADMTTKINVVAAPPPTPLFADDLVPRTIYRDSRGRFVFMVTKTWGFTIDRHNEITSLYTSNESTSWPFFHAGPARITLEQDVSVG